MDIACPKCGSHDLHADKKGFSGKKAVAGAVLVGGIGLLAGTSGSNKIRITCLACGNVFAPGQTQHSAIRGNYAERKPLTGGQRIVSRILGWVLVIAGSFFGLALLIAGIMGEGAAYVFALICGLLVLGGIMTLKNTKARSAGK